MVTPGRTAAATSGSSARSTVTAVGGPGATGAGVGGSSGRGGNAGCAGSGDCWWERPLGRVHRRRGGDVTACYRRRWLACGRPRRLRRDALRSATVRAEPGRRRDRGRCRGGGRRHGGGATGDARLAGGATHAGRPHRCGWLRHGRLLDGREGPSSRGRRRRRRARLEPGGEPDARDPEQRQGHAMNRPPPASRCPIAAPVALPLAESLEALEAVDHSPPSGSTDERSKVFDDVPIGRSGGTTPREHTGAVERVPRDPPGAVQAAAGQEPALRLPQLGCHRLLHVDPGAGQGPRTIGDMNGQ